MSAIKIFILYIVFFCTYFDGIAQPDFKNVKVSVKGNQKYYWDLIAFKNKDTSFVKWVLNNKNQSFQIDSIPNGKYQVSLVSVFYDSITQVLDLSQSNQLNFNVRDFYSISTSDLSFFDQITSQDTIRIYYNESGCFHWERGYGYILKRDNNFTINFKNEEGKLLTELLTIAEVEELSAIEKNARKGKIYDMVSTTNTTYSFELNQKVVSVRVGGNSILGKFLDKNKN